MELYRVLPNVLLQPQVCAKIAVNGLNFFDILQHLIRLNTFDIENLQKLNSILLLLNFVI